MCRMPIRIAVRVRNLHPRTKKQALYKAQVLHYQILDARLFRVFECCDGRKKLVHQHAQVLVAAFHTSYLLGNPLSLSVYNNLLVIICGNTITYFLICRQSTLLFLGSCPTPCCLYCLLPPFCSLYYAALMA